MWDLEGGNQAYRYKRGLSRWLSAKESACNAGEAGSMPGFGRSPGGENGNPLQYSCLGNSTDRGAWWATIQGVAKSQTWLRKYTHTLLWHRAFSFGHFPPDQDRVDPLQRWSSLSCGSAPTLTPHQPGRYRNWNLRSQPDQILPPPFAHRPHS